MRHERRHRSRLRRWLITTAAVATLVVVLLVFAVPAYLGPESPLQDANAIVAISGGDTTARTDEAISLYKEGWAPAIIFSGAAKDLSSPSNATVMANEAIMAGIPRNRISVEGFSEDTEQNAQDTSAIIKNDHFTKIILVTSPYHQRRASADFRHYLGPNVVVINRSSVDNDDWPGRTWWLHEQSLAIGLGEVVRTTVVLVGYHLHV